MAGEDRDIKLKQTSFLRPRPHFEISHPRVLPYMLFESGFSTNASLLKHFKQLGNVQRFGN